MEILTVNAGSASLRLAAFDATGAVLRPIAEARTDTLRDLRGTEAALAAFVSDTGLRAPVAVAHRIVHGGDRWTAPAVIGPDDEAGLHALVPLAPLHMPRALEAMAACRRLFGADSAQVAVFDTAFFRDLPAHAAHYALPADLSDGARLRRYGFHGIAHESMWRRWHALGRGRRLISLQLGSGSSITATLDGRPRDTSMGFSPLEGLVMATRCGDLDPGLLLHLIDAGAEPGALEDSLNRRSGLLGLSGISGDMRELLASDDPAAAHAIDVYCHRARKYLGAYLIVLGGVDGILFGGGVGEHSPEVRARILAGLDWLGIRLDTQANQNARGGEARISAPDSAVDLWVVPVDEAGLLAEAARALLAGEPRAGTDRRIS